VGKNDRRRGAAPGIGARTVEPWWGRPRAAAALVAALAVIAFARSLGNGFSYDEGLVIVRAQGFLRSGAYWALVSKQYFMASQEGTWRPLCTLTYMLDATVGMAPAVFKADSLGWHLGAALLVMALARRLLPARQARFALVAGLVFALHPVTTETVDNASFREDGLVTFWTLAALLLALQGRRRWSLLAFALGLLSKESAVVMPVLLAGVRLIAPAGVGRAPDDPALRRPRGWARAIAGEAVPYAVMMAAYLGVRFGPMNTPGEFGTYARYPGGTLGGTLLGMPAVWAHDLRLLVAPWPLCADYTGYFRFGAQPLGPVLAAAGVVAAYGWAAVTAARRGQALVALGLAWFAVALGPVSNFIPVPVPAAERFLYLPLVGIALACAAGAAALCERLPAAAARGAAVAGMAALVVFVALIDRRHAAWRDDEALWLDTVARNPRSCGAQSAVGGRLLTRGIEEVSPVLLREAAAHQELALSLCADDGDRTRAAIIYTRLGAARAMLAQPGPAAEALMRAIDLQPRYGLAVVWLGYVRYLQGDRAAAADLLRHAVIDLGPPDAAVAEVAQRYLDRV
jgi:hypothetical protein